MWIIPNRKVFERLPARLFSETVLISNNSPRSFSSFSLFSLSFSFLSLLSFYLFSLSSPFYLFSLYLPFSVFFTFSLVSLSPSFCLSVFFSLVGCNAYFFFVCLKGETDAECAAKAAYAQEHGLSVMGCIGESKEERESGWERQSGHGTLPYQTMLYRAVLNRTVSNYTIRHQAKRYHSKLNHIMLYTINHTSSTMSYHTRAMPYHTVSCY